nr:hypothetical protein Iba_chr02cCG4540 [Ipomoea batatas]GMC63976.1 hypothetical protein Iba_chr02dCG0500 [Ipomoea batatas]GMC65961.1 hypothetical protein Iba_chr02eCG1110 [Ipomoea batatas]GMD41480.1 hypothetical protein Iba_scaffold109001CG0010 [Ipomoea batatas]
MDMKLLTILLLLQGRRIMIVMVQILLHSHQLHFHQIFLVNFPVPYRILISFRWRCF